MNTRFPITRWAPDDRPREKLVKFGHKSLTSSELLAILLGSGTPNESAVMLAQRMLAQYDNHLDQLAQCSVESCANFTELDSPRPFVSQRLLNWYAAISNPPQPHSSQQQPVGF